MDLDERAAFGPDGQVAADDPVEQAPAEANGGGGQGCLVDLARAAAVASPAEVPAAAVRGAAIDAGAGFDAA